MKINRLILGVIMGSLAVLSACGGPGKISYNKDYKSIYAEELQMTLGDYTIDNGTNVIIEADTSLPFSTPEVRYIAWNVTYKDALGNDVLFRLTNDWGVTDQIYGQSIKYLADTLYKTMENRITAHILFINVERIIEDYPLSPSSQFLFPHYITLNSLPEYIVIQLYPQQETDIDQLLVDLSVYDKVTFFVMVDNFHGVFVKEGAIDSKQYTEEEANELIAQWFPR